MLLHCFQRKPAKNIAGGGEKSWLTPPQYDLPEARDHLAGQGVGPNRGDQAEQGDSGVPEFNGFGARLFHNGMGIW